MHFQAILPKIHNFFRYDSTPAFNRVDQKRHSLSSLSRYQVPSLAPSSGGGGSGNGSAASLSSRNSYQRRSAIIPRNNRRSMQMSAIKEHQRKFENADFSYFTKILIIYLGILMLSFRQKILRKFGTALNTFTILHIF